MSWSSRGKGQKGMSSGNDSRCFKVTRAKGVWEAMAGKARSLEGQCLVLEKSFGMAVRNWILFCRQGQTLKEFKTSK